MRTAVITFPASNCDRDAAVALRKVTGIKPVMVWHRDTELPKDIEFVIIPGGNLKPKIVSKKINTTIGKIIPIRSRYNILFSPQ